MKTRTYSELKNLITFEERYDYLQLKGHVGTSTFGFDRIYNQRFYKSKEWRTIRDQVIIRDDGCDLAISDRPINGQIVIHHMNPIDIDDLFLVNDYVINLEYLICCSKNTHLAIHYSNKSQLVSSVPIERYPGDTTPWRRRDNG